LRLKGIRVDHFRNLTGSQIQFSGPVTLFYGPNAQGKTNVLEAIYMLGTTRSFRENRLKYLVQEGAPASSVEGDILRHGVRHSLRVDLGVRGKRYERDAASVGLSEYLQMLPVVVLSVEDRGLVEGVPRHRRDFLDGTAVWRRPAYLDTLMSFGRAREQRGTLLKGYSARHASELEAWTDTFCRLGEEVRRERAVTARAVNEMLSRLSKDLEIPERVSVEYRPNGGEDLRKALAAVRGEEIRRGAGLVGPQRDAVEILMDGRPLASYGSGGQVRTALWLLKLTRVQLLHDRDAQPPVFLLDDVEAELDERRIGQMMNLTQGKAQLVMTATRPLESVWGPLNRFRVEAGHISEER
jgi:DNA replication and repair protein RecF